MSKAVRLSWINSVRKTEKSLLHLSQLAFEIWEKKNEQEIICCFVTSWTTKKEELEELDKAIKKCLS